MKIIYLCLFAVVMSTATYDDYYEMLINNVKQKLAFLQNGKVKENVSENLKAVMDIDYENSKQIVQLSKEIKEMKEEYKKDKLENDKKLDTIIKLLKNNERFEVNDFEVNGKFKEKMGE